LDSWGPNHQCTRLLCSSCPSLRSPHNCHHCRRLTLCILSLIVSPILELCVFQCAATGHTNLPDVLLLVFSVLLFSLSPFLLTQTGRCRWLPTQSLVLVE
ncbi:hypothetical protein Q8A73_012374, partial [Channa argus]